MSDKSKLANNSESDELTRVAEQVAARLRGRGVSVSDDDSADALASLLEAVERFEMAVEAAGGDLMVDEAPEGSAAEPDNPAFVLPSRRANETALALANRIDAATASLRR